MTEQLQPDLLEACPFEVTDSMLDFLSKVFPDRAPNMWDTVPQMHQSAGIARVTRWFQAVHDYQMQPKDPQGRPIEPEWPGEGFTDDLDLL